MEPWHAAHGRPRCVDPVASLPPNATPKERARAALLSERRAKNRVSATKSRRRKQARLEAAHREVAELRREHARLVAEHAVWASLLHEQYAQARSQHVQLCVSTCRWPAAACDLVIAARVHATLPLGYPPGGVAAPTIPREGHGNTAPAALPEHVRQAGTTHTPRGGAQVLCSDASWSNTCHLPVHGEWVASAASARRGVRTDAVVPTRRMW